MKLKNIISFFAIAAMALIPAAASAQGLKIITKDGKSTLIPYSNLEKVTVYDGKPQVVDLGLSVKWASCNVGATAPEECGNYFMWASTVDDPECKYNKLTCPYQDPDFADPDNFIDYFLKYCNTNEAGIPDYINTLEPMDDAATAAYGADWRMPTADEMKELIEKCTVTLMEKDNKEYNGVAGYKFTGPNGNSIFLPMGGYRFLLQIYAVGEEINYWTSSLYTPSCLYANALFLKGYGANKYLGVDFKGRYLGYPVRAVYNKK